MPPVFYQLLVPTLTVSVHMVPQGKTRRSCEGEHWAAQFRFVLCRTGGRSFDVGKLATCAYAKIGKFTLKEQKSL